MNSIYHHHKSMSNILIILSFIILAFISHGLLLYSHTFYVVGDTIFHFKRINELIISVKKLSLSPYSFNQFHGAAVMAFYPYLTLLPIIILASFIKSKIILLYSFFILYTFISLIISFFSCININKNVLTSYLFSIIYSFSPILVGYNYSSMDIGMFLSAIFLPLVIFGMIKSLRSNKFIELTIGLILIAYSNILSFLITILFLLIFYGLNYKITLHIYKNILRFILTICTMTSLIWVPITTLILNNKIHMPTPIKLTGLNNHILLKSFIGGINERGLGTFPILAIFTFLLCMHKCNKSIRQFYWVSLVTILICSKLFPWTLLPHILSNPLSHIQFVFRFLMVPILLLNYIFAYTITKLIHNKKYEYTLIFILILGTIGLHVFTQQYEIKKDSNLPTNNISRACKLVNSKQINNITDNGLHSGQLNSTTDYFPQKSLHKSKYIILQDRNNSEQYMHLKHIGFNKYSFKNKANNNLVLPIVCYKSEHLNIYINHHLINYHPNKFNLITLNHVNNKGYHQLSIRPKMNIVIDIIETLCVLVGVVEIILLS